MSDHPDVANKRLQQAGGSHQMLKHIHIIAKLAASFSIDMSVRIQMIVFQYLYMFFKDLGSRLFK
jgi:hypothetical protein